MMQQFEAYQLTHLVRGHLLSVSLTIDSEEDVIYADVNVSGLNPCMVHLHCLVISPNAIHSIISLYLEEKKHFCHIILRCM